METQPPLHLPSRNLQSQNLQPQNTGRPWVLAEANWGQVKTTRYEVAVLPWGATEAHNTHLPYATDNFQNEAIAAEAARLAWEANARVVVLPNVPFGVNTGQIEVPFCLNMNPSTQRLVLRDLIESVQRAGVTKFVILNGHGGNDFRQMLREIQVEFPTVFLSCVSWFNVLPRADWFQISGDHADEGETSLMMHLHPHLVAPLETAGSGRVHGWRLTAFKEGWAWAQRDWLKATDDTGAGDPSHSTAQKGEAFFGALCLKLASYFIELAAIDLTELYEE
jgi:creatinine amidohydrolase